MKKLLRQSENLANWFLGIFKPWFIDVTHYIGTLAIYFGIAHISNIFWSWDTSVVLVILIFLGFLIDIWAKETILKKRIKQIIDNNEEENIKKIIKNKNLIDHSVLAGIIIRTKDKLCEDGFYDEELMSIEKKVGEYIWRKHELNKTLSVRKIKNHNLLWWSWFRSLDLNPLVLGK